MLKIWNWILNFGVSDFHPSEKGLIQLYNGMSVFSATGTLIVTLIAWLTEFSSLYILFTCFIALLYVGVLVLNYFGKVDAARYLVSIGSPIWIGSCNFSIGGSFSQSMAILASMAISYVVFRKKPSIRIGLLIFQCVFFFLSVVYVNSYGPIFGIIDFPYDEITVFVGALGWTIIVLHQFDKDRNVLVENLKSNNKELKETTEELERFSYIASHDLKSPLRTIISFIGMIERDVKREKYDNIKENLSFVKTGAEQMNFLVRDILEFSRLKEHKKVPRTLVDLNAVLEKAKHNLNEEIKEKDAVIHCDHLPNFVGVEIEFLLLFQNFIQNGIKYNESNCPTISISFKETSNTLELSFKDNGIGIEEKYFEQIFLFFKRLHNSTHYQGTGLGLGLCKKIINNYNGEILLKSDLGQGSEFTIILPRESSSEKQINILEVENA